MMYMQEKQTTAIKNSETTENSNIYIYILFIIIVFTATIHR